MVESVLETASGSSSTAYRDSAGNPLESDRKRDYFSDQEDRILDHMMFGAASSPDDDSETSTGAAAGDEADAMGFSDGDLSTQFGRDAVRGHQPRYGGGSQHHQHQQGTSASASASHADPLRLERDRQQQQRRPRVLALAARARLAIRRSIMRTSKAVPSMRFPQMVACGMVFACRAVTKSPWCGAASFVGARCVCVGGGGGNRSDDSGIQDGSS